MLDAAQAIAAVVLVLIVVGVDVCYSVDLLFVLVVDWFVVVFVAAVDVVLDVGIRCLVDHLPVLYNDYLIFLVLASPIVDVVVAGCGYCYAELHSCNLLDNFFVYVFLTAAAAHAIVGDVAARRYAPALVVVVFVFLEAMPLENRCCAVYSFVVVYLSTPVTWTLTR